MDMEMIKALMSAFDASGLSRMKLEEESFALELEKSCAVPQTVLPQAAVQTPVVVEAPQAAAAEPQAAGTPVTSPIVGIYYQAASPESAPFVQVGQTVKKGQTLCIIEAMKVMNEVPSPCDGVVAAIQVQDGELVAYGQVIMVIQ